MIKAAGALILYLLTATVVGKKIAGKYTLMDGSTCSGGQFFIENSARCQTAAIVLGLSDTDLFRGAVSEYPYGCYDYKGGVVFNPVGSKKSQDSTRLSICSSEAAPPVEVVGHHSLMNSAGCAAPNHNILSLAECGTAATALDLGDVTPQVGVSTNKPYGCYYYSGAATNQLWFNTKGTLTPNTTDYFRVSLCSSAPTPAPPPPPPPGMSMEAKIGIIVGVVGAATAVCTLCIQLTQRRGGTGYVEMT
jgi:hypothetical protein